MPWMGDLVLIKFANERFTLYCYEVINLYTFYIFLHINVIKNYKEVSHNVLFSFSDKS